MSKESKIKIIIGIFVIIVLAVGSTYAAWNFLTDKNDITMTVENANINFNTGTNITFSNILPVYDMYSEEDVITKEIEIYTDNSDYIAGIDLYLNLKTWDTALSSPSFRWALYKNDNYLSSGDFASKAQGNNLRLTSSTQKVNSVESKDIYKLYMWLDAYQESSDSITGKTFTVNLYGQATFYDENSINVLPVNNTPNVPELVSGMIPVKYNYFIDEWVKADSSNTNNDWYNYDNKIWANAVMVKSNVRDSYMNADLGTTVNEDDILAYYVWIPRYRYVLFNTKFNSISPVEILIEFESSNTEPSNGTNDGEYLTHPAFWWDNDSNGTRTSDEEISGFWVGKFEISGITSEPLIKPNVVSLTNLNLVEWFNTIRNFGSTTYLSEVGVSVSDSHMIKNIEWGAIAYLSHSRYGKNSEIMFNNNASYITGRQGNFTYNDFVVESDIITPSKSAGTGTLASTTGNVYGVYDMSGGAYDVMMSCLKSEDGLSNCYKSGFTEDNIPDEKYYDIYDYSLVKTDFYRTKLGEAVGETKKWYQDMVGVIASSAPIYVRGGHAKNGYTYQLGIFSSESTYNIRINSRFSSRAILLVP